MSSRTVVQQIIDSNVYDNLNKEILASMMRTVLEELMNSNFNKTDDQLQNIKYNSSLSLAQYLSSVPVIKTCVIGAFDVGLIAEPVDVDFDGDLVTAVSNLSVSASNNILTIDFSEDITEKTFLFSFYTTSIGPSGMVNNTTFYTPVYRVDTATRISLGFRSDFLATPENLFLKLTII